MCVVCAQFRPFDPECAYSHGGLGTSKFADGPARSEALFAPGAVAQNAPLPTFTAQQAAKVLTDQYWQDIGLDRRSFGEDTSELTVDLTNLDSDGRYLARLALEAWTDVTGIEFTEVSQPTLNVVNEAGDAGQSVASAQAIGMNVELRGSLARATEDWFSVDLVAGQTYTFTLSGRGNFGDLSDPLLQLRSSGGAVLATNDDAIGLDSQITYTATYSGTHIIDAGSYNNEGAGTYSLEVSNRTAAQILFDDEEAGGYSTSAVTGSRIESSFVNVDRNWTASGGTRLGDEPFQVYMHEIGHALGLGHAGFYNGNGSYSNDAHYANDSWQMSIMSYFTQSENTRVNASFARPVTPMVADMIAARDLYDGDVDLREGNTTYGANSNLGGYFGDLMGQLFGDDATNRSLYNGKNVAFTILDTGGIDTLDLSDERVTQRVDLRPFAISDVAGLRGNMVIGPDTVLEIVKLGSANDTAIGNNAANSIFGNDGNDQLTGEGGEDLMRGGRGRDTIEGGGAADRLYGDGGADRLIGGIGADMLFGGLDDDVLYGNTGEDMLNGGKGDDELRGGDGVDELHGADGNDFLIGHNGWDILNGDQGDDQLNGSSGRDLLYGGTGDDRLSGGTGIDDLDGGAGNDTLWGNSGADLLMGDSGDDRLFGGSGVDTLHGGSGADELWGNFGADILNGDSGADLLYGGTGDDKLSGGAGADRLSGASGRDHLDGGAGNDLLLGGWDADTFVFTENFGADRIEDFDPDQGDLLVLDESVLSAYDDTSDLIDAVGREDADSFILNFGAGNSITFVGGVDTDLLAESIVASQNVVS